MNFKSFLKENLKPSIDDNDVLNTLTNNNISYTRIKMENGNLLYNFDNRYSIIYDGFVFKLYRQEDLVHVANARNLKEIEDAISMWGESYELSLPEEISNDEIEDFIDKLKSQDEDQPIPSEEDTKGNKDV